jgi:hypothetical protein
MCPRWVGLQVAGCCRRLSDLIYAGGLSGDIPRLLLRICWVRFLEAAHPVYENFLDGFLDDLGTFKLLAASYPVKADTVQKVANHVAREYARTSVIAHISQASTSYHEGWGAPGTRWENVHYRSFILATVPAMREYKLASSKLLRLPLALHSDLMLTTLQARSSARESKVHRSPRPSSSMRPTQCRTLPRPNQIHCACSSHRILPS